MNTRGHTQIQLVMHGSHPAVQACMMPLLLPTQIMENMIVTFSTRLRRILALLLSVNERRLLDPQRMSAFRPSHESSNLAQQSAQAL